jgi:hypothetical protein
VCQHEGILVELYIQRFQPAILESVLKDKGAYIEGRVEIDVTGS